VRTAAALVALAVLAAPLHALDLSAGGVAALSYGADYGSLLDSSGGDGAASDEGRFSFEPMASLSLAAGSWALEAQARGRFEAASSPAEAFARLESAHATLWAGERAYLEVAYGLDEAAAAEVFPLTTFLGPSDPLSRLESWGGEARRSEPFLKLGAVFGALSASFACAPFAPPLVVPSLDSHFFPSNEIPESIVINGDTYYRGSLAYTEGSQYQAEDFEGRQSWELDPSYIAGLEASLGPFDLGIRGFSGLERQASLYPIFVSPASDGEDYGILLEARRARVQALAASCTFVSGSLRAWTEACYTKGASLSTGSAFWEGCNTGYYLSSSGKDFFGRVAPILALDKLAATGGASYQAGWTEFSALFLAELSYAWYLDAPEGIDAPTLSRAAALSASLGDASGRLQGTLAGIVSLADASLALRLSLSYELGGDRGLELAFPLFLGPDDSELGQYSGRHLAYLGFTQKF
jgi:hypothetical protein